MLFSSPVFLFLFLPVVLALYALTPRAWRNALLFVASLVFYAWDDPLIAGVMLASIVANWAFGIAIDNARDDGRRKLVVALAIAANLALLGFFKYWNFLWDNLIALGLASERWPESEIALPIGISFFTFQAMSYVIDVQRRDVRATKNIVDFGMYKTLFPQLIAGPIVRYRDVAEQIVERHMSREMFARGVRRFVVGLGKKMLIANVVAEVADKIYALDAAQLDAGTAWLGAIAYTLQIYFDFSGYSDMAIGLGLMLGFTFLENFDYPYIARSVTDFWRRWHISLSSWFRDYLYIPLGGNRRGPARTYVNLLVVFFLCGLWHGAAWNFVVWGLFHGVFLVLERMARRGESVRGDRKEERGGVLGHAYTLLVVVVGWVFFRAATLGQALDVLKAMAGFGAGDGRAVHAALYLDALVVLVIACGVVGSTPWLKTLARWRESELAKRGESALERALEVASIPALALVFVASSAMLAAGTYNPFIYFRF